MPYVKYKKIKATSEKNGMGGVDHYIDDEEKTTDKTRTSTPEKAELKDAEGVSSMQDISDYVEDEMKTYNPDDMQHLVTAINCESEQSFVKECDASKKYYRSIKDEHLNSGQTANEGFHIIMSCKGKDLDPELIHRAGIDFASELAGSDFCAKICTHLNTDNYHNHIAICAYSRPDTYPHKFKDDWHLYKKLRRISDEISLRYGFDLIIPGLTDKRDWAEYLEGKTDKDEVKSILGGIKSDIRECAAKANNVDHYKSLIEARGYQLVQNGTRIKYVKEGTAVTDYRLGSRYSLKGISEQIEKRKDRQTKNLITKEIARTTKKDIKTPSLGDLYVPRYTENGHRIPAIIRLLLYIKKCIERVGDLFFDPSLNEAYPENLKSQPAQKKLAAIDEAIRICEKYDIKTLKGLKDKLQEIGASSKMNDYKAEHFYAIADRMGDLADTLKIENHLKMIMESLGINDADFKIKSLPQAEIEANLAALDPMTGKQKRQLYNALSSSGYALKSGSFSSVSAKDADEILSFLNGKTDKKPETLITKSEQAIIKKAKERINRISSRYEKDAPTNAQLKILQTKYSDICELLKSKRKLNKAISTRIISKNAGDPLPKILSKNTSPNEPLSSWMRQTLTELSEVNPDRFKDLDLDRISKTDANNLIDYELSQHDTGIDELISSYSNIEETQSKPQKINYDSYTEEEKLCIAEYKHLLEIKAQYGLNTREKISSFLYKYEEIRDQADKASEISRADSAAYKDLNHLQNVMKNCTSKQFIFGVRHPEKDNPVQETINTLSSSTVDDLQELDRKTEKIISDLSSHPLSSADIKSITFEPLKPEIREVLKALNDRYPSQFSSLTKPIQQASEMDAYEILTAIKSEKLIEKDIEQAISREKTEEMEKDKERQRQSQMRM